jgi:hypothetical protein
LFITGLEKSYLLTTNGKKEFSPILLEILHSIGEECGSIPLEATTARPGHSYALLPLCLMYLRSIREKIDSNDKPVRHQLQKWLQSSLVRSARKLKPKYFKLTAIIVLAVGKRRLTLMCSFDCFLSVRGDVNALRESGQ